MAEDEIPDKIQEMMAEETLENMRNRNGWRKGRVVEVKAGAERRELKAWIEIFDGEGGARKYKGVRFMAIHERGHEGYPIESYAYESKDMFEKTGKENGWYVK